MVGHIVGGAEGDVTHPAQGGQAGAEVEGQPVHLITLDGGVRVLLVNLVPGDDATLLFSSCERQRKGEKGRIRLKTQRKNSMSIE